MTAAPPPASPHRRRPFALLALAGILVFKASLALLLLLGISIAQSGLLSDIVRVNPSLGDFLLSATFSRGLLITIAVLLIAAAIGLITLRRRGWLLAMVITGVFVASDIVAFTQGTVNYLWMGLNIVTVFYLNQADVREVVGVSTEPLVPGVASS